MAYPPTIADYYRESLESARGEVEHTPDDQAIGMDVAAATYSTADRRVRCCE